MTGRSASLVVGLAFLALGGVGPPCAAPLLAAGDPGQPRARPASPSPDRPADRSVAALRADLGRLTRGPMATSLTAAAASDVVAWVERREGVRTLFVARGPAYRAERLDATVDDTGDELDNLALSPDGRFLAYTRGPDAAPTGETPNPASLVAGPQNALWIVPTATGGAPLRLGAHAESPNFSPGSTRLAFLEDHALRLVELPRGAGAPTPPRTLWTDVGNPGDLAWSHADDALAFVSYRGTHSFVGIYRLGAPAVQWVAPSIDRDMGVAWSPDDHSIAFLRIPGRPYTEVRDVLRPVPFEILLGDPARGTARTIFHSAGADAGVQTGLPLGWLRDGRIAFLADSDGYSHLYALAPGANSPERLVQGACDLESFTLDARGERIAVAGNCFDRDRADAAVWTLGHPTLERVSPPGSIAADPTFLGESGALAYRSASVRRPATPALAAPGDAERLLGMAALSSSDARPALVEPEVVHFAAPDGTPLTGILFRPRALAGGQKVPAVVYVHGGPTRQMYPGWHPLAYYAYTYAENQFLASEGIAVLAVNYRTGTGFGRAFRAAAGSGPKGLSELADIVAAGRFLAGLPEVDPARLGIYGGSYGGHLAANALGRYSALFRAGVAWHGIYDFTQWISNTGHPHRLSSPWGASEATRALAFESSALSTVPTWRSPVLLVGGDDDRNVDFDETVTLASALRAAGVPVSTLVLPNEVHGFLRHASWLDVLAATSDFLLEHLEPAAAAPTAPQK